MKTINEQKNNKNRHNSQGKRPGRGSKSNGRNQSHDNHHRNYRNNGQSSSENENAMTTRNEEMILMAAPNGAKIEKDIWIADSGATTHMTNNLVGMFDLQDKESKISVGNGKTMTSSKTGKWRGTFVDKTGSTMISSLMKSNSSLIL